MLPLHPDEQRDRALCWLDFGSLVTLVPYCDNIDSTRGDGHTVLLLVLFEHDFDVMNLGVLNSELRVGVKKVVTKAPMKAQKLDEHNSSHYSSLLL